MERKPKSKLSAILDIVLPFVFAGVALLAAVKSEFRFTAFKSLAGEHTALLLTKGVFLLIAGMLLVLGVVSIKRALNARK